MMVKGIDIEELLASPRRTSMSYRLPTKFRDTTKALRVALEPQGDGSIVLPFPPSVNDVFGRYNGSRLSQKYRTWRDFARHELHKQDPKPIAGRVSISIELVAPDKRRRDLDNCAFKAVVDLLVKSGIIEADDIRIVREITARWVEEGPPCRVRITRME